jgi:thiol-disulfide isomerase/thioredoxin
MLSPLIALALLLPASQTPPAPAPAPQDPPKPAPAAPAKPQSKVAWYSGTLEKALLEAKTSNKLVFADFGASWCSWCMKMNREVFSTDEVGAALENVISVSIDYDKQRDTAERFLVGKDGLPVVIWFNSDGTVRERIDFFQDKDHFLANAARIKADIGTINDLRRKIVANPADLDQRFELYKRLKAAGDAAGAALQRAEIEKSDPQGSSRAMHNFKYEALKAEINATWQQSKSLDPKQIQGLWNFMEVESDPELVWDGWMSLSNTYKYWGEMAQARGDAADAKKNRSVQRDCLARAWRGIPQDDDTLRAHVTGYASLFWDLREELSAEDKSLLLTMTEMVARRLENEPVVQHAYAQALFLSNKSDAALAACERAIELGKATGFDPQNFEKTLALIRGGGK